MKLLVVTGAGASHALSPDPDQPLPLMADWATRLQAKLGTNLAEMTTLSAADDGVTFEETLGALFRWLDALPECVRFGEMVRPNEQPDHTWPNQFKQALNHARQHADRLERLLHESLFEEFGPDRIDVGKARDAYGALFEALTGSHGVPSDLVCATTNYDRSPEIALDELGADPRTGFVAQRFRSPQLEPRGLGTYGAAQPAILYLHGAVGWYRTPDGPIVSMPADRGYNETLGTPAVLYPGPDKDIARAETVELWREFEEAIVAASHVFVLGHNLNDQHLLTALRQAKGPVAVSYHSRNRPTKGAAEEASRKEQRINEQLPEATPIAIEFGAKLSIDSKTVSTWRRAGNEDA